MNIVALRVSILAFEGSNGQKRFQFRDLSTADIRLKLISTECVVIVAVV